MLGLDYSDKTAIPTVGFNVEIISDKMNNNYTFLDICDQDKLRCLWKNYYQHIYGIIWVVDSNDRYRMDDNADIIKNICTKKSLKIILF